MCQACRLAGWRSAHVAYTSFRKLQRSSQLELQFTWVSGIANSVQCNVAVSRRACSEHTSHVQVVHRTNAGGVAFAVVVAFTVAGGAAFVWASHLCARVAIRNVFAVDEQVHQNGTIVGHCCVVLSGDARDFDRTQDAAAVHTAFGVLFASIRAIRAINDKSMINGPR